jgi:signal transduction histidine kinase
MHSVVTSATAAQESRSRWGLTYAWAAALIVYFLATAWLSGRAVMWINDIGWTLAAAAAALCCFQTARRVETQRRKAWLLFGIGCTSWLIGQLHWNYAQLIQNVAVPFPSIGQLFYTSFAVFVTAGVWLLPEARQRAPFTFRQVGNVGLVSCCLAAIVVLGMLEPALQIDVPPLYLWIGLGHTLLVAATFLSALYALWTYRWGWSWRPMLVLVLGTCIYAVSNLVYAHALLTSSYLPGDAINASWLVMFGCMATAAREQCWVSTHVRGAASQQRTQLRERWLEAVVPALLIIIMVAVAVSSSAQLTPRVIAWAAALFILFAIILGAREAWIQRESQQLNRELVATNERLQSANAELRLSEARYRELNTALEQRVSDRTRELKRAYDELEGFSYAVAHDLKAPLRAINGFAHLLEAELESEMSGRVREHLMRIRNGSIKMSTLIDDLLSYSHIDSRSMQPSVVSLPGLIDSVVSQFGDEVQRRQVTLSIATQPISVRVDAGGLALALRNLLENALKYTRETPHPRIEIDCHRVEGGVLIALTDNGIGFDMEYHDHIFKIFQRLHREDQYPGTGIGLALVRKAVERIGGRVWAKSRAGEGATFFVELPKSVRVEAAGS